MKLEVDYIKAKPKSNGYDFSISYVGIKKLRIKNKVLFLMNLVLVVFLLQTK